MLTKETRAGEAVDTIDFIPSRKQNTFNKMISNQRKNIKVVDKIKVVLHYLQPNHWFDRLLDNFEVDLNEFKHVNNDEK